MEVYLCFVGVKELLQSGLFVYVYVEDVVEVYVVVLELIEVFGCYICYECVISEEKFVEFICKFYLDSFIFLRYIILMKMGVIFLFFERNLVVSRVICKVICNFNSISVFCFFYVIIWFFLMVIRCERVGWLLNLS